MKGLRGQPQAEIWFPGTPQDAFLQAKKQKKLVFLYWGAIWCPPCNELKANVFSKARFAEIMQSFVPVYLDGDTEEAQIWGEQLKISGYPTVLVLDSERQELFRLNSSVSLDEFDSALQGLLGKNRNFARAIEELQKPQPALDQADWRLLAFADWMQLSDKPENVRIELLQKAAAICPENLQSEKALLTASLLSFAASAENNPKQTTLKTLAPSYLKLIFAESVRLGPLRVFINNEAGNFAEWLHPAPSGKDYEDFKKQWLDSATAIAKSEAASIDTRLWSINPRLQFFRHEQKSAEVPVDLKKDVKAAVELADQQATQAFDRHAVISGAAFLLRQVKDYDGARELLKKEATRSDTPWYYYSSLAALEEEVGSKKEAQKWAALARQSAQGRASKIQWITSDILMNAKPQAPAQQAYLASLATEYYDLATELSDGFVGRNRTRAEKVKEVMLEFKAEAEFVRIFKKYADRCAQLQGENQKFCQQHFKNIGYVSE